MWSSRNDGYPVIGGSANHSEATHVLTELAVVKSEIIIRQPFPEHRAKGGSRKHLANVARPSAGDMKSK